MVIYLSKPRDFNPTMEVVGCFLKYQDTFLVLQYAGKKKDLAGLWGCPAGKMKASPREKPFRAMIREIHEETEIQILPAHNLTHVATFYDRYIEPKRFDFIYHLFVATFEKLPEVKLSTEHQAHRWITPTEALKLPLITDEDACIKYYYLHENMPFLELPPGKKNTLSLTELVQMPR